MSRMCFMYTKPIKINIHVCVCLYTYMYMYIPGRKHSKLVVLGGGNNSTYYFLLCYFRYLSLSQIDVNVRKWWTPRPCEL